jgi:hypothetical protein
MRNTKKLMLLSKAVMLIGVFSVFMFSSCKPEEVIEDPIASFQFEVSTDNPLQVIFENFSQNAETYSWNFGDGQTSTEQSPTHTYAEFGEYTVVLTATNKAGVSSIFQELINVQDPFAALTLLAGQTSKTWRLMRVGASMGVGPDIDNAYGWWFLENDGSRPCVYFHEFTFNRNMEYIFDDKGSFWSEGISTPITCMAAIPENMITDDGVDVSAWLGGTHQFEYNVATSTVTLTGLGAWIGLPKVATGGEVEVPQTSVSFQIEIEEHDGYDHMFVKFIYDWGVWVFNYASYSNPALEPPVEEEEIPFGEDLPNITPTELYHTFESETTFALIGAIGGTSVITPGEEDPDGGSTNVGKFERVAGENWQEAQLRTTPDLYDIQFDNFSVAKIDIFIPSDTEFTEDGLQRFFVFGFADLSQTQEWWNSPVQFTVEGDDVVLGAWTTYEFDLTDVKAREDLDMIYLGIGGGGHGAGGIFYVRNLVFE